MTKPNSTTSSKIWRGWIYQAGKYFKKPVGEFNEAEVRFSVSDPLVKCLAKSTKTCLTLEESVKQ